MQNRVYLVGLTGSGKTTLAPCVAALLGWPWVDLDAEIEARTGRRIPDLFVADVAAFRRTESATLAEMAGRAPLVVATGGGAILSAANRELMRATGTMVALEVTPQVAGARIQGRSALPPILGDEPAEQWARLRAERAPLYAEADIAVDATDDDPAQTARRIVAALAVGGRIASAAAPTTVAVPLPRDPYAITIGTGTLAGVGEHIAALGLPLRATVITEATVADLFLAGTLANLARAGIDAAAITVPAGEGSKSLTHLATIYDGLIARRAERGEVIIALGGGVVGDLAGFAAATYLRGVPLIHIPTTLLAQVDSAIGGKTGINHPRAKNAIGAFHQPRAVLCDPAALLTLGARFFREGWGEIVKYGMALDADLFAQIDAAGDALLAPTSPLLPPIIARCAAIKAGIVSQDEREAGPRLLLNYGHTVGHALEAVTGYGTLLHGEAVFIGMAIEARIAVALGMLDAAALARQDALCARFFTPPDLTSLAPDAILDAARLDKKTRGARVRWVLPTAIGAAITRADVPDALVLRVLRAYLSEARG